MSYSIFVDEHRGAAMLVCDEPLYGLGPAVVADDTAEATEFLQAFVDALEGEPDEMPTIQLWTQWSTFLMAFHGMISAPTADEGAAAATEVPDDVFPQGDPSDGLVAVGVASGGGPGGLPADTDGQGAIVAGADDEGDGESAGGSADYSPDPEASDMAARLSRVPGGTPAQRGVVECWSCGGTGIAIGIKGDPECAVCAGTGRVPSEVQ